MYERILVPTDGSDGTAQTLDHAITLATNHDAAIYGLYVVDRRQYRAASAERQDDVLTELEAEGEEAIAALRDAVPDDIPVETDIREGTPHKVILDYADEIDADVITIGTHGRTGRERLVSMGSVTEKVLKESTRPVFVVDIGGEA